MKRKYFLRGMGLGILITVAVFSLVILIQGKPGGALSEEEIISQAIRLGMVMPSDSSTIQEDVEAQANAGQGDGALTPDADAEGDAVVSGEETTVETLTGEDVIPTEDTTENHIAEETEVTPNRGNSSVSGSTVTFRITQGQSSDKVGENLFEAGLVDSASAFDRYLENRGDDKRIRAGTFEIEPGSTYKTIADIITN